MMKAAVRVSPGRIEVEDRSAPGVADGRMLIRVVQVGICGGDLHYFRGAGTVTNPPKALIVGHEAVGTIEVGTYPKRGLEEGDRVVIDPQIRWCGQCDYCLRGKRELCGDREDMGYMVDGSCADFVSVPKACVYRLPDKVSWSAGTIVHGLAAAVHALDKVPYKLDATAVVLGSGPAGLYFTQLLKHSWGARQVILVGRTEARLDLGVRLGADEAVDSSEVDVRSSVMDLTSGDGADIVIETTGARALQEMVVELAKPLGSIVAYAPGTGLFQFEPFLRRELQMYGSTGTTGCMRRAIRLIESQRVSVEPLVSHRFPLSEIQAAFEMATSTRKGNYVKGVIAVEQGTKST